jgi:hypothetical protein
LENLLEGPIGHVISSYTPGDGPLWLKDIVYSQRKRWVDRVRENSKLGGSIRLLELGKAWFSRAGRTALWLVHFIYHMPRALFPVLFPLAWVRGTSLTPDPREGGRNLALA